MNKFSFYRFYKLAVCLLMLSLSHVFANGKETPSRISFDENKGQVMDQNGIRRNDVLYMGINGDAQYVITRNGVSHQLHSINGEGFGQVAHFSRVDMQWVGATFQGRHHGYNALEGSANYYSSGADKGSEQVQSFEEVRLFDVYPGIDVRFYSINGVLEYDFELAPDADWHQIKIQVSGSTFSINQNGELVMPTALGTIQESAPKVFQEGKPLESRWVKSGQDQLGFEIIGAEPGKKIIIDPVVLIWSNQVGGSGTETGDAITIDASGSVIVAGTTSSVRNIATSGAHQTVFGGQLQDAYLAKFDGTGRRIWATYYGSLGNETGQSCAVDGLGNIYLAGQAGGAAPGSIATVGSYQSTNASGSFDLYLAKFNSSGVRQWATYYGGSGVENWADCATDISGNIFLAGITNSAAGIATTGAHQATLGGSSDGFLVKFNTSGSRLWSTYYGGSLDEGSQISCATDVSGFVALAGETRSTNNIATSGSHQQSYGGMQDAWVARFTNNGVRTWGSYIGGTASDRGRSVAFDGNGNVIVTGWTSSTSAIATSGAYQTVYGGGTSDAFVASFQTTGSINWSTYKGGSTNEQGYALTVENSGNIFVLVNGPTSLESFASNGQYVSNANYNGPFYGALLNLCSGGNGVIYASGQANNNILLEKYQVGSISGQVFNDVNQNCQLDAGEVAVPNMRFMIQPGNQYLTSLNT